MLNILQKMHLNSDISSSHLPLLTAMRKYILLETLEEIKV